MSFNKVIKEFDEVTANFNLTYSGVNIWPYLRFYSLDKLHFKDDRKSKVSSKKKLQYLGDIFYGFFSWFKSYDALIFNVSGDRKLYNSKWAGKSDFISKYLGKSLFIELPNKGHFKKSEIPTKNITSKLPLLAIEKVLERFVQVPNELNVLEKEINSLFSFESNLTPVYKQFVARHWVTRFLVKVYQPKFAEVNAAYVDMPRVLALKQNDVTVIEMQHGNLNPEHHGYQLYNVIDHLLSPDYLLTFGTEERDFFERSTYIEKSKVFPIGSFYLDYIAKQKKLSESFDAIRKSYDVVIAATGQDAYDDIFIPFLMEIMNQKKNWACIFIPRSEKESYYRKNFKLSDNTFFVDDLNTYETILQCDIHTTVNSTCAVEALALGTPNVLYDYQNKAKTYFKHLLEHDPNSNQFVNSSTDFIKGVENEISLTKQEVIEKSSYLFVPDFSNNLDKFFKQLK
ncbi:MAG: hypothetical protein ACPGD5_03675 [Salibacteraceae bacterium]